MCCRGHPKKVSPVATLSMEAESTESSKVETPDAAPTTPEEKRRSWSLWWLPLTDLKVWRLGKLRHVF